MYVCVWDVVTIDMWKILGQKCICEKYIDYRQEEINNKQKNQNNKSKRTNKPQMQLFVPYKFHIIPMTCYACTKPPLTCLDGVDAGRQHFDQHLIVADAGHGHRLHVQHGRGAERVDPHSTHRCLRRLHQRAVACQSVVGRAGSTHFMEKEAFEKSRDRYVAMAEDFATLQAYNNELVKCTW